MVIFEALQRPGIEHFLDKMIRLRATRLRRDVVRLGATRVRRDGARLRATRLRREVAGFA